MTFNFEIKLNDFDSLIYVTGEYYTIKDGWLNVYIWDDEFENVLVFSAHDNEVAFIKAKERVDI